MWVAAPPPSAPLSKSANTYSIVRFTPLWYSAVYVCVHLQIEIVYSSMVFKYTACYAMQNCSVNTSEVYG